MNALLQIAGQDATPTGGQVREDPVTGDATPTGVDAVWRGKMTRLPVIR